MNKIIFDTNFIMTCLKEKVDFLDAEELGEIVLPLQVLDELKKLSEDKKLSLKERETASLALQIIEKNKGQIKFIEFRTRFVDKGIFNYAVRERGIIVATFDRELKSKLGERVEFLIIRGKGKLDLE